MPFCFSVWFVPAAFLYNGFHCCMHLCVTGTVESCRLTVWLWPTWWRRCRSRARCSTSSATSLRSTRGWSSSRNAAATLCVHVDSAGQHPQNTLCLIASLYYVFFHYLKNPSVIDDGIMQLCFLACLQRSDNHRGFPSSTLPRHRLRPHGHGCRLPQQRPVLSSRRLPQQLHQAVSCWLTYLLVYIYTWGINHCLTCTFTKLMCQFTTGDKVSQRRSLTFTLLNHFTLLLPLFHVTPVCVCFFFQLSEGIWIHNPRQTHHGWWYQNQGLWKIWHRIGVCIKSRTRTSQTSHGRWFTCRICHVNADTWHTQICDGSFPSPFSTCRWPSVTLRRVTWTPVCISGRSCQEAAVSQDQPSSLTKTGRRFPLRCFHWSFKPTSRKGFPKMIQTIPRITTRWNL